MLVLVLRREHQNFLYKDANFPTDYATSADATTAFRQTNRPSAEKECRRNRRGARNFPYQCTDFPLSEYEISPTSIRIFPYQCTESPLSAYGISPISVRNFPYQRTDFPLPAYGISPISIRIFPYQSTESFVVIWLASQDSHRTIELLHKEKPHHLMAERHTGKGDFFTRTLIDGL